MANKANLAIAFVETPPTPDTSGTSLDVTSGGGSIFPAPPFYATAHEADQPPTGDNAEIIQVTAVSTDTFTIVRAQRDTSAQPIAAGWVIVNGIYKEDFEDLEDAMVALAVAL